MHIKPIQILIILLSSLPSLAQYCKNNYFFEHSSVTCGFYFQYSDPNCTDFHFDQCEWTECTDWVTVGNDTSCDRWETFTDYSWNYCTSQCCDNSVTYPYAYNSITQCQQYLD